MPYNDDWTGFDPTFHEIVYADEFIGQVTIQKLNSLCDRNTRLNAKYGGVIKSNKVLVIVLSNFTIAQCYKNVFAEQPHMLDTLKERFHEMKLERRH